MRVAQGGDHGDSRKTDKPAKQAEKKKSFLPLQSLWIFVQRRLSKPTRRKRFFSENFEVKPPHGEEWRRVMWKMGSRGGSDRGCRDVASSAAVCRHGGGSTGWAPSVPGRRPVWKTGGQAAKGFTGERQGDPLHSGRPSREA